ncbi:hypothetical protein [Streptomyces sp. NPDC006368]|uniref:hypothetical protein n=1 Tax=Streptomyces sp. NPDC006368 TaxID=3156760 RepID=UPI0033A26ED7
MEAAIVQLYALLVFPHMVFGQYGADLDDDLTERLVTSGVNMFLTYYAPDPHGTPAPDPYGTGPRPG